MSRYILKAECATAEPFVDFLQSQTPNLTFDPKNLTVFVGDKAANTPGVSVMPCSGGLYAPQQFMWKNLDAVSSLNPTKLFLDANNITVTLSVDLQVSADASLSYGVTGTTIPQGALAINLGNKGFQFNSSNMINGDEWGKLVYYEQGGLGIGWAFNADTYLPRYGSGALGGGLGMYMLGGMLPDVTYETLVSQTSSTLVPTFFTYNLMVSRDQALLTQMVSVDKLQGPQGYWSVQPTNFDPAAATSGRLGGTIAGSTGTVSPTFSVYNPLGFPCLSFPTAMQSTAQASQTQGWNLLFPSYGPSTQDGYMMTGNCLSVSPGAFFTEQGLALLQNQNSSPSSPAVSPSLWTEYWSNATNNIHLEETKPFYIEAPLFNAPVAMNLIPNYQAGLSMLVPITRICNGVYLYTPVKSGTGDVQAVNMNTAQVSSDPNYFSNSFGTLQKWFVPKRVSLTINMPFVRIDTPIQASRFFGTPYLDLNYTTTVPVWIKFHYQPTEGINGALSPASVDTAATLTQIIAASQGGIMQFIYSAREILNRFSSVLMSHNQPVSANRWGLQRLEISRVMVSCTTDVSLRRLYSSLFGLQSFMSSPQGAILSKRGMKVFSRCGASLSAGAPSNMSIQFDDVLGDAIGYDNGNGVRSATFDINDVPSTNYGMTHDDYFNSTAEFVFARSVFLRMPDAQSTTDSGGKVVVSFSPRPVLNMPFSGEVLKTSTKGGPQFANSTITTGNITSDNLRSYSQGWFNNLNPFSQDYNTSYAVDNATVTKDTYPFMDYKLVDFNRRKIEIWFQLQVPIQVYTGTPFS